MEKKDIQCHEVLLAFQQKYYRLFKQPIIKSFLQDNENWILTKQAICHPTKRNMEKVDDAFQAFYKNVRILTYLSSLIYYNAINFDKYMKKHYNREMLTLDQPLQTEEEDSRYTHKDMLYQPMPDMDDMIVHETIADYVEDFKLYQAIQVLTVKQQKVLTLKYVHRLQNKEIAQLFSESPQNVSKIHRRALQKLKIYLEKG